MKVLSFAFKKIKFGIDLFHSEVWGTFRVIELESRIIFLKCLIGAQVDLTLISTKIQLLWASADSVIIEGLNLRRT